MPKAHIALKTKTGGLMPICNAAKANTNGVRWVPSKMFDALPADEQCEHCKREIASLRKYWAKKKAAA